MRTIILTLIRNKSTNKGVIVTRFRQKQITQITQITQKTQKRNMELNKNI